MRRTKFPAWMLRVVPATLLLLLTNCTPGPNYHRPDVPLAPAWKEQAPWRAASPQDSIPKGNWWALFGDSELEQYETRALKANQSIEAARNQLEQARASARITQSGLFPQMSAAISGQRARISQNQPTSSGAPLKTAVTQNVLPSPST